MKTLIQRIRNNRLFDILVFAAIVLGILALIRFLPALDPVEVKGAVSVIDGDSVIVQGVEIRLLGIDAPERDQMCTRSGREWPCGAEAARGLRNHVRGRKVSCRGHGHDAHDRLLAVCTFNGKEINRWIVEQGWALSYDNYLGAERAARKAKRGIWTGSFVRPRDWREENR